MKIHHLNCVTMCPPGGRLMDGRRGARGPAELACHCLLIELSDRLVLVDTGFGLQDVEAPRSRLSPLFRSILCRPRLRQEDTAVRQIERLGFYPNDVQDIILTHLDFDHAGGLDDFPRARVHLLDAELQAASSQATWLKRQRFRPSQWSSRGRWRTYAATGETWHDFAAVRQLDGLPAEIVLVPLLGHTLGHAGVAVMRGDTWLLHAGDAYFYRDEMRPTRPRCTPGLRLYQWLMDTDRKARLHNQRRLRHLVQQHGDSVRVFCAHDIIELQSLRALSQQERGDQAVPVAAAGSGRVGGVAAASRPLQL